MRSLLQTAGGEVIFTTIEKFQLKERENVHPILNTRPNVILIADEAHRSQYGFKEGYARYLSDALPNAMRLGFTGTPISLSGADTVQVFGDLIHTYDIKQSQDDKATVPIYYEPRQIPLKLTKSRCGHRTCQSNSRSSCRRCEPQHLPLGSLSLRSTCRQTLGELAEDLLAHYLDRSATLKGKAMVVCMERENCVKLYEALTVLTNCPEVKIIMTGSISEDPVEWGEKDYLSTKGKREAIKQRMIDQDDPLKMVIVCDMWLTGTDIPCLHTLYVDKPMQGHNMIQAISRVNRVFSDKPHGLIVDYIGIGDALREATNHFTRGAEKLDVAAGIDEKARPIFFLCFEGYPVHLTEEQEL